MATNSAQEQLMLELVNRARMNPAGEAARFGISLNQGLAPGTISATPKQVLAMNDRLVISSDKHSNWMLINDIFDHNEVAGTAGFSGVTPGNRMTAAGYVFSGPVSANGENISWTGSTGAINATTAIIGQHQSLFLSPGHRFNILNDTFREIGVGQQLGEFDGFNASMVTQNFALSGTRIFVTGVVYNETVVNDNFFTVGEQLANRAVTAPGLNETTGGGGGYELGFAAGGVKTVSFNLPTGILAVSFTLGSKNLKIDAVNGHEIWTNANLTVVSGPVTEVHALGIEAVQLVGSGAADKLFGNAAANRLTGAGGNDIIDGGAGADRMLGMTGNDTYKVDNAGDVVDETGGSGGDVVHSTVSLDLSDAAHAVGAIEAILLLGTAAIKAFGNASVNALTGNAGANVLRGYGGNDVLNGGVGQDTLTGGANDDFFVFNAPLSAANRDLLNDFANIGGNNDTIRLENSVMTGLGAAGTLNANLFHAGSGAHDANDRIIYHQPSGALSYDANGNDAGGSTLLATISTNPVLTAADFVVI
jgi:Ca2+-binding RTX toxin-like protein